MRSASSDCHISRTVRSLYLKTTYQILSVHKRDLYDGNGSKNDIKAIDLKRKTKPKTPSFEPSFTFYARGRNHFLSFWTCILFFGNLLQELFLICPTPLPLEPCFSFRTVPAAPTTPAPIGSVINDDGDGNKNGKKAIGWDKQKKQLCTPCITLFCTFLSRHCTTTTWNCQSNFTFWQDNDFLFLLLNLNQSVRIQPQKIANIWRIERDGISPIKFIAARIHFLSHVFVAVALTVVVALATWRCFSLNLRP